MTDTLAVVFGGPSDEHDISILTGLQSSRILSNKYDVLNIYWSKDNKWYLVDKNLESIDFLDNDKVLNEGGLRNEKEFVNHKILDLVGDFLLSGHRILGKVECHQGGHELTNLFLRKVFKQNNAFEFVELKDFKISEKFVFLFVEGLKSEPILDINELKSLGLSDKIKIGETISVLLEKIEDKNGEVIVSASKAQKIKGWDLLVAAYELSLIHI